MNFLRAVRTLGTRSVRTIRIGQVDSQLGKGAPAANIIPDNDLLKERGDLHKSEVDKEAKYAVNNPITEIDMEMNIHDDADVLPADKKWAEQQKYQGPQL